MGREPDGLMEARLPESHRAVIATGENVLPIWQHHHRPHPPRMAHQAAEFGAGSEVP